MYRKLLKFAIPIIAIIMSIAIVGYLRSTKPAVEPARTPELIWTVSAISAEPEDIRPQIRLFGEIVSGRTIELRSQVSGKVVHASSNLIEGGIVREGDVIVDIDSFAYEAKVRQKKAELLEAGGRLRELRAELNGSVQLLDEDMKQLALRSKDAARRLKLRGSGAGTEKSADDARLKLSEAKQRQIDRKKDIARLKAIIDQQTAKIDRLEVSLSVAERNLTETRIFSPAEGFVFSVDIAEGKWINVGDKVARLIDANRLEAKVHISRQLFRRIIGSGEFQDRPARIFWRGSSGGRPFSANVNRIGSEVDARTGGVNLYAKVRTGGVKTSLRPGAFVEVYITDRLYRNVYRIPANALYERKLVYIVEGGRLEARKVRVEVQTGGDLLIKGEVERGDMIVTTRLPEAASGQKVRVQ